MKTAFMKQILEEAPLLEQCLKESGTLSLREYCCQLAEKASDVTAEIEPSEDVKEAVCDYLLPLVGKELAEKTARQVLEQKLLLTANHHEAEFCVQALQGNMLYAYILEKMGYEEGIVPVFSNTTVNMSNENFPRGMLVYRTHTQMERLPVFPFRERNSLVAEAAGYTQEMVYQTQKTVKRLVVNGTLEQLTGQAIQGILEGIYLDKSVLENERYAIQAFHINRKLGRYIYADRKKEFLYIELEEITKRLLYKDLKKTESLTQKILFSKTYRESLTQQLNGKTGCWDRERNKGTWMFWGVDVKKRRFSLFLEEKGDKEILVGSDMEGNSYSYEYSKENILELLKKRKLLPGLFLSFFELYFLRSYTMAGGCFQSLYLKDMCEGICGMLESVGGYEEKIEILRQKKCHYLSGPMFLLGYQKLLDGDYKEELAYPLGTVELMEQKGIRWQDFCDKLSMTMEQAHIIGIYNFYLDLIPKKMQSENWYRKLSLEFAKDRV